MALNPLMKLQMDSTTMYGLGKHGIAATVRGDREQVAVQHLLGRRLRRPARSPTPATTPSRPRLKPTKGDWLFFVTTDPKNKVTEFTASEAEFVRLRDKFHSTQN